jgi:hypothetical protein
MADKSMIQCEVFGFLSDQAKRRRWLDSPGSGGPAGIAFGETNIWVADNRGSTNVKKLRVTDGTVLGTFPIGSASSFLSGVVSDGANILVTDTGTTPAAIL